MRETIAVVDDEQDILELVSLHLKKNHFSVREFSDGSSFIKYLDSEKPDLVVLDLFRPNKEQMNNLDWIMEAMFRQFSA